MPDLTPRALSNHAIAWSSLRVINRSGRPAPPSGDPRATRLRGPGCKVIVERCSASILSLIEPMPMLMF
jgi:hypothetical protein